MSAAHSVLSLAPSEQTLADWVKRHPRLFILTGAGISTAAGIPDYRDHTGRWKISPPVQYQDFINSLYTRQRYWARSLLGWPRFQSAQPSLAHQILAELETAGFVHQIVTQNVDGLHQRAGSRRVIDLHGRLDRVECLDCKQQRPRTQLQEILSRENEAFLGYRAVIAPDGDAQLDNIDFESFRVPDCPDCQGLLKPRVVFFGENVPRPRVEHALQRLQAADAVLAIGTSLMVYSGFRFCRAAAQLNKPIAAINLGKTRADELLSLKVEAACDSTLQRLRAELLHV